VYAGSAGGQQGPPSEPVATGRAPRRGRRGGRADASPLACGLAACGAVGAWIPYSSLSCGVLWDEGRRRGGVAVRRAGDGTLVILGVRAGAAYRALVAAGSWRGRTVP